MDKQRRAPSRNSRKSTAVLDVAKHKKRTRGFGFARYEYDVKVAESKKEIEELLKAGFE